MFYPNQILNSYLLRKNWTNEHAVGEMIDEYKIIKSRKGPRNFNKTANLDSLNKKQELPCISRRNKLLDMSPMKLRNDKFTYYLTPLL